LCVVVSCRVVSKISFSLEIASFKYYPPSTFPSSILSSKQLLNFTCLTPKSPHGKKEKDDDKNGRSVHARFLLGLSLGHAGEQPPRPSRHSRHLVDAPVGVHELLPVVSQLVRDFHGHDLRVGHDAHGVFQRVVLSAQRVLVALQAVSVFACSPAATTAARAFEESLLVGLVLEGPPLGFALLDLVEEEAFQIGIGNAAGFQSHLLDQVFALLEQIGRPIGTRGFFGSEGFFDLGNERFEFIVVTFEGHRDFHGCRLFVCLFVCLF